MHIRAQTEKGKNKDTQSGQLPKGLLPTPQKSATLLRYLLFTIMMTNL